MWYDWQHETSRHQRHNGNKFHSYRSHYNLQWWAKVYPPDRVKVQLTSTAILWTIVYDYSNRQKTHTAYYMYHKIRVKCCIDYYTYLPSSIYIIFLFEYSRRLSCDYVCHFRFWSMRWSYVSKQRDVSYQPDKWDRSVLLCWGFYGVNVWNPR